MFIYHFLCTILGNLHNDTMQRDDFLLPMNSLYLLMQYYRAGTCSMGVGSGVMSLVSCVRVILAMSTAPSYDLLPPMNPEACTNIPFGIPDTLDRVSSRSPRHFSNSGNLLENDPNDSGTHCTLQL